MKILRFSFQRYSHSLKAANEGFDVLKFSRRTFKKKKREKITKYLSNPPLDELIEREKKYNFFFRNLTLTSITHRIFSPI